MRRIILPWNYTKQIKLLSSAATPPLRRDGAEIIKGLKFMLYMEAIKRLNNNSGRETGNDPTQRQFILTFCPVIGRFDLVVSTWSA
jgi:hypothetical protein